MIRRMIDDLVCCSWKLFCEAVLAHSPSRPAQSVRFLVKIADCL